MRTIRRFRPLGYTNLYELAYSSADMSVSVKRSWDYSAKLCDQYGHDLVADGSGGYFLTNHTAVWHLDPDAPPRETFLSALLVVRESTASRGH